MNPHTQQHTLHTQHYEMIEIEDEDFLSQVAALEAQALSSTATKRRKVSHFAAATTTASAAAKGQSDVVVTQEGAYLAALRGSKSPVFFQKFTNNTATNKSLIDINNNNDHNKVDGVTCYKCGKLGHWARDCDVKGNGDVADKQCPCGLGNCIVLTANTEKNSGRKFYKCPTRQENGGCGFFEWCDNSAGTDGISFRSQPSALNHLVSELLCPCGAGSCLILTAKTGKNIGQQFYKCPAGQGGCGFFKWCSDQTITSSVSSSVNPSPTYQNITTMTNKSYNASNFSCFKCGKEGHWSKDCNRTSSNSPADKIGYNTSSGTCFKCGKDGHWARDCNQTSSNSPMDKIGNNVSSCTCFKCGKEGHWAKDCNQTSSNSSADKIGYNAASSGTCFKCGKSGHWAKDCFSTSETKVRFGQ